MRGFEYYSPTRLVFGRGTQQKAGELVKGSSARRTLLLSGGGSAERTGILTEVRNSLSKSGVDYIELSGVKPNPVLSFARRGMEICRREGIDFILAVGGGSVIDTAKAISLGVENPERDLWEFFDKKLLPGENSERHIGIGCVLTLAAAGSEAGAGTVLMNDEVAPQLKRGFNFRTLYPVFSIMNPEFLATVPDYVLRCSVTDIMMHTMERYFTPDRGNRLTDAVAFAVLRDVTANAKAFLKDPSDYDAASEIMWASTMSHNGMTGIGARSDFATHQLGHELSGMFDKAHGATLSAVWGSWARFVADSDAERFADFGRGLWDIDAAGESVGEAAEKAISATERFFGDMGMPLSVPELMGRKLSPEEIDILSRQCAVSQDPARGKVGRFMELDAEDIKVIYNMANAERAL